MSILLARSPRLIGAGLALLAGWLFTSAALHDHDVYLDRALVLSRVHKPSFFQINAGFFAFGLWLLIWAIPRDEKTDRPREWWMGGLLIVIVLAVAGRGWGEKLVVLLFR